MEYKDYFKFRRVGSADYAAFKLPPYLIKVISEVPNPRILDFGCGFGQMLNALKVAGVTDAEGIDIEPEAIRHCREQGFRCTDGLTSPDFYEQNSSSFDFIIMSHVLEHIPKEHMIDQLEKLRRLLKPGGSLLVMVPNAQSNTGAYWAYEDFTHYALFTSGSLYYVLRAAGFQTVNFLDVDCTTGLPLWKRLILRQLLRIYTVNYCFWNRVTDSKTHAPSPLIFSYEIKARASV